MSVTMHIAEIIFSAGMDLIRQDIFLLALNVLSCTVVDNIITMDWTHCINNGNVSLVACMLARRHRNDAAV